MMVRSAGIGRNLLSLLLLLVVVVASTWCETSTVRGFAAVTRGVGRRSTLATISTTTSRPVLPWKRFQQQDDVQEQQMPLKNASNQPKRRQKLWRNVVAVVLSAAAVSFGRRGFATNAAHAEGDTILMSSVVTSKQQTSEKALPTAKSMRGPVLVAAGAGAVLGWNLVQIDNKLTSTSSSSSSRAQGAEEDGSNETRNTATTSKPNVSVQDLEDESSRVRAQKFVEDVLKRMKDAQRKAFSTLSSSAPPAVSNPSYLESLSSSSSSSKAKKTSPLPRPKPVTPKQPPVGMSYLDSLSSALTRKLGSRPTSQEVAPPSPNTEAADTHKEVTSSTKGASSSTSPSPPPRRRTAAVTLNPLKSLTAVSRHRKWNKARQQPKPPAEEDALAQKYAALSVPDRAYQILVDLGMVEPTSSDSISHDDDHDAEP